MLGPVAEFAAKAPAVHAFGNVNSIRSIRVHDDPGDPISVCFLEGAFADKYRAAGICGSVSIRVGFPRHCRHTRHSVDLGAASTAPRKIAQMKLTDLDLQPSGRTVKGQLLKRVMISLVRNAADKIEMRFVLYAQDILGVRETCDDMMSGWSLMEKFGLAHSLAISAELQSETEVADLAAIHYKFRTAVAVVCDVMDLVDQLRELPGGRRTKITWTCSGRDPVKSEHRFDEEFSVNDAGFLLDIAEYFARVDEYFKSLLSPKQWHIQEV